MIQWRTLFSAGDLGWMSLISILPLVFYIAGFIIAFIPPGTRDDDQAMWRSLPLHTAMLTVAWSLWVFTMTFAPSIGTVPTPDPDGAPMLSGDALMAFEDAKKDETDLQGRGGVLGNMNFLAMDLLMPVLGNGRLVFAARRPNYHLPLLLEFCFRWSSFMIVVLPLTLFWSRSLAGIRLGLFTLLWSTLVFAPVVHAISGDGWLEQLGAIDFSLGLVLLASGCSVLFGVPTQEDSRSSAVSARSSATGSLLMWLGMLLHVSAYAFRADGRAAIVMVNMLAGTACGILIWSFCNSFLWKRPFTENSVTGTLAGLAAIAPGAGVMLPQSAMILGCSSVAVSNIVFHMVPRRNPDDPGRQLFSSFGVGSLLGLLGAGIFATTGVGGLRWDGREIKGVIEGNNDQLLWQGLAAGSVVIWSVLVTWLLFRILRPQIKTA